MKKKKFIKKAMAVLLSAAMVLSAAGCGGKTADNGTASQTAGTENPESAAAQGSGADALEPYTITWAYIGATYQDTDLVEAEMNKILQPKFNCTIDIIGFSWGEYTQKLNLMLSGDEPLDMVPVIYGNGASYLNNGQIIDMKDLIDK